MIGCNELIRAFDFIMSLILLLILLPLFIPVIIILLFTGEGEVFYKQSRVGINQNEFLLLKFATMLKDSPRLGSGSITLKNDPRVLPFGKFLRKTKINELPQLFNVLVGDMSLIGPRPLTSDIFYFYKPEVIDVISTCRPGLSGIGSIVFRDEERLLKEADDISSYYEAVISPYKGKLECWYASNQSLMIYFICILLTIYVVLKPSSKVIWQLFKTLPTPPEELQILI